jgi:hypothetical protein
MTNSETETIHQNNPFDTHTVYPVTQALRFTVLPVFGKKIKFHSLPWCRVASGSSQRLLPYFGTALAFGSFQNATPSRFV